jgi:hypothetical protein
VSSGTTQYTITLRFSKVCFACQRLMPPGTVVRRVIVDARFRRMMQHGRHRDGPANTGKLKWVHDECPTDKEAT